MAFQTGITSLQLKFYDNRYLKRAVGSSGVPATGTSTYFPIWDSTGALVDSNAYQTSTGYVFNDTYADKDFQVRGLTSGTILHTDATRGNVSINSTGISEHYDLLLDGDGVLGMKAALSPPTADSGYGKLYTPATNTLWFQDGGGTEHKLAYGVGSAHFIPRWNTNDTIGYSTIYTDPTRPRYAFNLSNVGDVSFHFYTSNVQNVIGGSEFNMFRNQGVITNATGGLDMKLLSNDVVHSASTIADLYGIYNNINKSGGTCDDLYGIYSAVTAAATVNGSVYGLYLKEFATVNYGIYQDGTAENRLGGLLDTDSGRVVKTTRVTTTPYAVLVSDHELFVDTDGGARVLNLPAGVDGTKYTFKNCGTSGNDITLNPNGAELLFGFNASQTISDGEILDVVYETTEGWY